MSKAIFMNPAFETKINKAVFFQQDLVVYPDSDKRLPDNIGEVIRFLFGEGTYIKEDVTNGRRSLTIAGACFLLQNVRTLGADYITTVKE